MSNWYLKNFDTKSHLRVPTHCYFLNLRETMMDSMPIPIRDNTSGSGTLNPPLANAGTEARIKTKEETILFITIT